MWFILHIEVLYINNLPCTSKDFSFTFGYLWSLQTHTPRPSAWYTQNLVVTSLHKVNFQLQCKTTVLISISNRSWQQTVLINPSVNKEVPKVIKFAIDLVSLINFTRLRNFLSTISPPSIVERSLEFKLKLICGQATFATQSIHMVTYRNLSAEQGPSSCHVKCEYLLWNPGWQLSVTFFLELDLELLNQFWEAVLWATCTF